MESFSTKFSGLRETVPDTEDYILLDKIGMGMGVYSGVYEYTQQIQEQIQSIQSIQGIWAFAELQAGSLQYNSWLPILTYYVQCTRRFVASVFWTYYVQYI